MIILRNKNFGVESAALGIIAPGAYQAKEAAKYAYNKENYRKNRGKYALLGAFSPNTATYIKKKAEKMAKEGKSREEIRKYLDSPDALRIAAGLTEAAATPATGGAINLPAVVIGLKDKIEGNRAWDQEKELRDAYQKRNDKKKKKK